MFNFAVGGFKFAAGYNAKQSFLPLLFGEYDLARMKIVVGVRAGEREHLVIRTESHLYYRATMRVEIERKEFRYFNLFAGRDVPKQYAAVSAARCQNFSVRCECETAHAGLCPKNSCRRERADRSHRMIE